MITAICRRLLRTGGAWLSLVIAEIIFATELTTLGPLKSGPLIVLGFGLGLCLFFALCQTLALRHFVKERLREGAAIHGALDVYVQSLNEKYGPEVLGGAQAVRAAVTKLITELNGFWPPPTGGAVGSQPDT